MTTVFLFSLPTLLFALTWLCCEEAPTLFRRLRVFTCLQLTLLCVEVPGFGILALADDTSSPQSYCITGALLGGLAPAAITLPWIFRIGGFSPSKVFLYRKQVLVQAFFNVAVFWSMVATLHTTPLVELLRCAFGMR